MDSGSTDKIVTVRMNKNVIRRTELARQKKEAQPKSESVIPRKANSRNDGTKNILPKKNNNVKKMQPKITISKDINGLPLSPIQIKEREMKLVEQDINLKKKTILKNKDRIGDISSFQNPELLRELKFKNEENNELSKQMSELEMKYMDLEISELLNHKKKLSDFDDVVTKLSDQIKRNQEDRNNNIDESYNKGKLVNASHSAERNAFNEKISELKAHNLVKDENINKLRKDINHLENEFEKKEEIENDNSPIKTLSFIRKALFKYLTVVDEDDKGYMKSLINTMGYNEEQTKNIVESLKRKQQIAIDKQNDHQDKKCLESSRSNSIGESISEMLSEKMSCLDVSGSCSIDSSCISDQSYESHNSISSKSTDPQPDKQSDCDILASQDTCDESSQKQGLSSNFQFNSTNSSPEQAITSSSSVNEINREIMQTDEVQSDRDESPPVSEPNEISDGKCSQNSNVSDTRDTETSVENQVLASEDKPESDTESARASYWDATTSMAKGSEIPLLDDPTEAPSETILTEDVDEDSCYMDSTNADISEVDVSSRREVLG